MPSRRRSLKAGPCVEACRAHARRRRSVGEGAGIVFGPVDPVRIGGKRVNSFRPGDRDRKGEQKLAVAAALAAPTQRHRGFAAGKQQHGLAERAVLSGDLAGDRGMHQADIARLALDRIRQDDRLDPCRLASAAAASSDTAAEARHAPRFQGSADRPAGAPRLVPNADAPPPRPADRCGRRKPAKARRRGCRRPELSDPRRRGRDCRRECRRRPARPLWPARRRRRGARP